MLIRNASSASLSIWAIIDYVLDNEKNEFDYSIDEICKITGRGRSTIRKGLDDLVSYESTEGDSTSGRYNTL